MTSRALLIIIAVLLTPFAAIAATPFTSNHPEEAYPDNAPPLASPGPNSEFIKRVQQKLHGQGFDAGPINCNAWRSPVRPSASGDAESLACW